MSEEQAKPEEEQVQPETQKKKEISGYEFREQLRNDLLKEFENDPDMLHDFCDNRAFNLDSTGAFLNSVKAFPKRLSNDIVDIGKSAIRLTKQVFWGVSGSVGGGIGGTILGAAVGGIFGIVAVFGSSTPMIASGTTIGYLILETIAIGAAAGLIVGAVIGARHMIKKYGPKMSIEEQEKAAQKALNKERVKELEKVRKVAYEKSRDKQKEKTDAEPSKEIQESTEMAKTKTEDSKMDPETHKQAMKKKFFLYDQLIKLSLEVENSRNGHRGIQKLHDFYEKNKADLIEKAIASNPKEEGKKITDILPSKESLLTSLPKKPENQQRRHSTGSITPGITDAAQEIMENAGRNAQSRRRRDTGDTSQQSTDNNSPSMATKKNDPRRRSI